MVKPLASGIVACLLFVGAWKIADHALWERRMGAASVSWPSVEGSVIRSGFRTSGQGSRRSVSADIHYRYAVDGTEYENDRIRFGATGGGDGPGRWGSLGQLAPGESLTIYFDPNDPQQAALETGATGRSLGLLGASGALVLFGGILLRIGFASRGPRRRSESP